VRRHCDCVRYHYKRAGIFPAAVYERQIRIGGNMPDRLEGLLIPDHIAIILDGNGRWAEKRKLPRAAGHKAGCEAVEQTVRDCAADRREVSDGVRLFHGKLEKERRRSRRADAAVSVFT
jgi:undecaprenyl pyrophosphate synthase